MYAIYIFRSIRWQQTGYVLQYSKDIMLRRLLQASSLVAFLVLAVAPGIAAVQDRISSISAGSRVPLAHSVPAPVAVAQDLGPVAPDLKLSGITFRFNITPAQQTALTQLLIDQQNPSSPRYHRWLTPEQYGSQFGLSNADLSAVNAWLTAQGLTVVATSRSRSFVTVAGTAAQVQQALHTSLHNLTWNGEQHFANMSDPALPAQIAAVVANVSGLSDFRLKSRARVRTVQAPPANPQFTSSISGNHYLVPGDFDAIYDVNPLLTLVNGTGIKIAVMGQTNINLPDVASFRAASGLPANVPTVVLAAGSANPGIVSTDVDEAHLDIEWAGAIAPNVSIVYVESTDVLGISLQYAIDQNIAPIVSISYGECEAALGLANLNSFNLLLQQANVQGETVVGPGGDSGATDCDYLSGTATQGLAVDFPASSPFATGAGGTMFNEGSALGATQYWNGTDLGNGASATGYIPEAVWNETVAATATTAGALAAGGGGASQVFTKPYWQTGPGVPADSSRDVPDISFNAAAAHDGYLFCSQGSCVTGFRAANGQTLNVVGGTSVATPAFASILALVEQQIQSSLGNANPVLYAYGNSTYSTSVFHDITTGDNKSPCVAGTLDCPNGGSIGYTATPGYDLATGWGSVDAYNLATKWRLVTPASSTGVAGTVQSTTTITTGSPICGVPGSSLSLSITVAAAASAAGGTPAGAVQLLVDGTATGAPIPLVNGTAAYTFNTAGLSSGGHVLSAVYSGDNTFAPSKNTLNEDVVSSTLPDFTFTPCTAAVTVTTGQASPGTTLTLGSVNGFSGSVSLTAASIDPTLGAGYLFSVTPVALTSGASATSVFTLQAYQVSAKTGHGLIQVHSGGTALNGSRSPWYVAGSGATLACMLIFTMPRRRRWGALLAVACTVGVLGASGCGAANTLQQSIAPVQTNATPGTYSLILTATSGAIIHTSNITVTIQ